MTAGRSESSVGSTITVMVALRSADQDQPTADTQLPPAMSKAGSNSEIQGKHEPKGPKDPKDPKDPPPTDPGTPSPNPEPGTFLLLGTAAAAALKLRRRS